MKVLASNQRITSPSSDMWHLPPNVRSKKVKKGRSGEVAVGGDRPSK